MRLPLVHPLTPPATSSLGDRSARARTIPALDGVRGVAILAVLAHQLILDVRVTDSLVGRVMIPFQAGWAGVELFFVLSGFLITGILWDTRDAENYWSSFFVRRSLRIFPPYYLLLVVTFLIVPRLGIVSPAHLAENRTQAWYWLYLTNWRFLVGGGGVTVLGHCWSLAVEEQFYLVWPFVVRGLRPRTLFRLCVAMVAGAFLLRLGLVVAAVDREIIYACTLTRADGLALGAAMALLIRHPGVLDRLVPHLRVAGGLIAGALVATFLASGGLARNNAVTDTIGHSVLAIASALLILVAALDGWRSKETAQRGEKEKKADQKGLEKTVTAFLSRPLLRLFGKHSYAIYILHLPFHLFASRHILTHLPRVIGRGLFLSVQGAYMAVASSLLLGMAVVVYYVFERPILDLKRFFVARRPALEGAGAPVPDPGPWLRPGSEDRSEDHFRERGH